jgi:hypothetical protein
MARNIRAVVPGVQGMQAPTALVRAIARSSSKWGPGHWRGSGV